jgi:hypothetical protein
MKLMIRDFIGIRCIIEEDGQKVYEAIHQALKAGGSVILDFQDVIQFASPFFNFAIGQLLKDIKEEELSKLLKIVNLNNIGCHIVKLVIENASKYQKDVNYQKIVDDILEQQARDSQ